MKRIMLFAVLLFVLPTIGHGQGAVSIDQVNTLMSDYAIRPGEPARFVFRLNNTTGQKCNVSNGFKISSPDGAVWDSVTIDSAGLTTSGENRFAGFFDIAFALWGGVTMGGDGSNPDTVGVLGAGNPSRATRMMPAGYNDTAIAVIVWMHNATSAGKQICIDTAFWGSGGTWVWVGSNLVDFFPTLSGLPGQPYSNGLGVNRDGSGFCFEINDVIPPVLDTVHVPSDYATIQGAVNAVNPDGVVLVDPGTYTESITITGKKVDVKSTNGALTTIITNSDGTDLVIFLGPETNGSVIEGFTLQGGRIGIWCQNSAPIIRRNLLRSQHATSWAAIALSGEGWGTIGQSPAQIINNTIFGNTGGGISTFSTIAPTIKNTIIANNVKYGIHVQDDMNPQIALSYNDVYGNPVAYFNVPNPGTGTITSDPLFAGDFTLQEFSPCINAGDPAPMYNDPDGSRNDIGAFPFDGSVEPPTGDTLRVPQQYPTIQAAIDAAQNGQVVLVDRGSYTGGINFNGKLIKVTSVDGPQYTRIIPLITPDTVIQFNLVTFDHGENSQAVLEGFRLFEGNIGVYCRNSGPTIRRNIFERQRVTNWAAIALADGPAPAIIENNTIMGCANGGISTFSTIAPIIRNNIIYNNAAYGIHKQSIALPIALSYNDIYGNPHGNYNISDFGPGAISLDPQLDMFGALTAMSPCIDAGDPNPVYNDPDGSRNDIGAVPYGGDIPPGLDTLYVPADFPTIQLAVDAIVPGGTVLVSPGTYTETVTLTNKIVNLKSVSGPLTTVLTNSAEHPLVVFEGSMTSGSLLEGFTLLGGYIGVWCKNSAPIIKHNLLKNQNAYDWAALVLSGHDYGSTGASPATIVNNTITGNTGGGISNFSTVAPIIKNNNIAFNAQYGIHAWLPTPKAITSFNNVIGGSRFLYFQTDPGPGSISADPLFAPDFTLLPNSPCINAGDPDPIFNDPDGSRNDMGALPFGGSGPSGLMNLVQWRAADGGNDHWYAVIPEKLYWIQADAKAKTFAKDGIPGHLATIGSPFENQFIVDHVLMGANQNNRFDNFFIGGRDTGGQWQWITDEPWGYTNWASGEPNNVGIETALCMYGHYDTYSHAIPGTWNNALPDGTVNQLHQYWSVIEFGVGDTVVVDEPIPTNEWISLFCAAPNLDGVPLSPGAVIRAFDPQGVLCGKASVKSDGSIGFLPVYRDDPYTSRDEGAIPGDKISFRINNEVATVSPAVYWTQNGDQFQTCAFERNACITLHLQQGWNLISWNVGWGGAPRDLLTPIINCVEFVLGFDHGGLVYDPQLERFSTLSQVDFLHGYWVKMSCAADLEVCGDQLPVSLAIPVDAGWNLVSYLPMTTMSPSAGFLTINANLQVAIGYENGARIYVPTNPSFNTLTILEPGAGYWLRMSAADVLEYGFMPADGSDPHLPSSLTASNGDQLGSRVWMSLYGEEITVDGLPLASNSSIEVYSPSGELVGRGTYADRLLKFMPVYGYDGDDGSARLARSNDQLTLKVNGEEIAERIIWTGEGTTYRLGALTTASLPSTYSLAQNYPNPFNPATTIAFAVPRHQHVRIVVFNLLGQEVRTLTDDEYDAGRFEVVWDGRDRGGDLVPTGLYFYRMESGEVNLTRKMMLLK